MEIGKVLMTLITELNLQNLHLVHIGAHQVEEAIVYDDVRFGQVSWIEADPELISPSRIKLSNYPKQRVYEAAIYKTTGEHKTFYKSSNSGMSSSLLKFDHHKAFYPTVNVQEKISVITETLDHFFAQNFPDGPKFSVIILDIQGGELDALIGGTNALRDAILVVSEVSRFPMYKGQGLYEDIDKLMQRYDYRCIKLVYNFGNEYGDAIWIKKEYIEKLQLEPILISSVKKFEGLRVYNKFLILHRFRVLNIALKINQILKGFKLFLSNRC
jgi:FkbM family methyltransferase